MIQSFDSGEEKNHREGYSGRPTTWRQLVLACSRKIASLGSVLFIGTQFSNLYTERPSLSSDKCVPSANRRLKATITSVMISTPAIENGH